jgi:hypothetical protein
MGATARALAAPKKFLRLRLEMLMNKDSGKRGRKNIELEGYRVIVRRGARQASV